MFAANRQMPTLNVRSSSLKRRFPMRKSGCEWLAFLAGCLTVVAAADEPNAHDPRNEAVLANGWKVQCGFSIAQSPAADRWETVTPPFCLDWSKAGWLKEVQKKHGVLPPLQFQAIRDLWFERSVDIPAPWAGKRILLRIDRVERDAVLFVDGVRAGYIPGEGGAVDISALVHPETASVLRLYVTTVFDGVQSPLAWTAHRRYARDRLDEEEAKRKSTSVEEFRRQTGGAWVSVGLGGGIGPRAAETPSWTTNGTPSFYGVPRLQALPRSGSIEDVFNQELRPQCRARRRSDNSAIELSPGVQPGGRVALSLVHCRQSLLGRRHEQGFSRWQNR
jgi:hypothetical protein